MKQTALEWFLTEFKKEVWFEPDSELDIWINELIPKAKEMEKEQICEAHSIGYNDNYTTSIQYYNETYNQ